MPHQKRVPTNFTIECILSSKNEDNSKSHQSHSPLHPLNKVLESNPWIPNCSLVHPFNPSSHRKINFANHTQSIANFFNYPSSYVNQPFTSAYNYFYPTTAATTSTEIPPTLCMDNFNHQPKYSVYEDSCDNLNRNDSLSLNLSVNNSAEIINATNNFDMKSSLDFKCAICSKIFENCEMLRVSWIN